MERFGDIPQALPDQIPMKSSPEEVEGKLTADELLELNTLFNALFIPEPGDVEINGDDPRFIRWQELNAKAQGI